VKPFWETKSLDEMTPEEWESLCDGCGNCCLEKIEDTDSGEIAVIPVACENLDTISCRCLVYENRDLMSSDCILLTVRNLNEIDWLPETCAYRLLSDGKDLPKWHPLVSGNPNSVHKAGISVRGKVISGCYVHPKDIMKKAWRLKRRNK
jgi:uncharacterized cysteine cluster protein YcgN (CxxCxxCC family)